MTSDFSAVKFRAVDGKLRTLADCFPPLDELPKYLGDALAGIPRFQGYGGPYSVAQHCCLVDDLSGSEDPALRLALLLHDAAEAIVGDVPKPWKDCLPDFRRLEARVNEQLRRVVGIPGVVPGDCSGVPAYCVHRFDSMAMRLEAMNLFGSNWRSQFGLEMEVDVEIPLAGLERVVRNHLLPYGMRVWDREQSAGFYANRVETMLRKVKDL